jgi:hypothetical protein
MEGSEIVLRIQNNDPTIMEIILALKANKMARILGSSLLNNVYEINNPIIRDQKIVRIKMSLRNPGPP